MKRLDFNHDWTVKRLSGEEPEKQVTLPHDAMLSEPRTEESLGEGNTGWYLGGDYEYRKTFEAPEEWADKTVFIGFESVYHNAEVYLNGEKIAEHSYGYTPFSADLGPYLKFGEANEIRVIARNSDQPNSRWYSGTGIYRPVHLYVGEKAYIPIYGLRVRTLKISPALIGVEVRTSEDGHVSVEITDGGNSVARAEGESTSGSAYFELNIEDAQLWSTESPKLYTCRASFGNDETEAEFGIRLLEWGPDEGLAINGEHVILRGACVHHDNGLLGACTYPEAEERKVRILKENGYNAIRSSHYPASIDMLEACDRIGMLMMDEYVDVWYIHKTKYDYAGELLNNWEQDLKDMVDRDFNHPCVILYSTGNEVSETAQEKGIELTGKMTNRLHELDPTRPVTCGINIFFNFLSSAGFGVYSDDKAEAAADAAKKKAEQQKKEKKKHVGSDFYNTLACAVGDNFMKLGATLPMCDAKTRDAYANMDIAGYNYGIYRYKHDLKKYPNRLILGSETFCKDAYRFYEIAKKEKRIIGDFVWAGWDYIGETGEGAAEYSDYRFDEPETRMTGGNGRIDLLGKPRVEAAYTRVAFERETGPFIAVYPVYEDEKLQLTGWQLSRAVESWAWRGCDGKRAVVEVYARAASVKLYLNGKAVAKGKPKAARVTFKIPYEDGVLTACSFDSSGKEIGRYSLKTAGEETLLRAEPEKKEASPGELVFVPIRYTDQDGIWKPMEKHFLTVKVENGTLMGLGNASPYVKGNYTDDSTPTYFGEAMAVVRAAAAGGVTVCVEDEEGTKTEAEILCR